MQIESQNLEQQIKAIQEELKKLPEGSLICAKNGKNYKWYHSKKGGYEYISKKQRSFAEKLAVKEYLICQLNDLQQEKFLIDKCLNNHNFSSKEHFLNTKSEHQKLLSNFFHPVINELQMWAESSYKKNNKYLEQLTFRAPSGDMVRSKSELMIASILYENKIPFHYEESLFLGIREFFPDFTIRHPQTGKLYYWEHFGMMDNPEYSKRAFLKMQKYSEHGIIPSINLITTYETKDHPLTMETLEKIVEQYLL